MTPKQWDHLNWIRQEADQLIADKFKKGSEEHHDDLQDLSTLQLVDEAIGEAVDMLTYLLTVRKKFNG